jgi:hypothetical protein
VRFWRAIKKEILHLVGDGVALHEDAGRAWPMLWPAHADYFENFAIDTRKPGISVKFTELYKLRYTCVPDRLITLGSTGLFWRQCRCPNNLTKDILDFLK